MSSEKKPQKPAFPATFEEFEKSFALPQHLSDRFRDLASSINSSQPQGPTRPTHVPRERVPAASAEELQKLAASLREKWGARKASNQSTTTQEKDGGANIAVPNTPEVEDGIDQKVKIVPHGKYQAGIKEVQDEHFVVKP